MKELILLVGPPGSGKSTHYLKNLANADTFYVNQDTQGKDGHLNVFNMLLEQGRNIVVDRMNFSKEQRNRYLVPAKANGYKTRIVVLHVPYTTCVDRCEARTDHPTIKDRATGVKAVNFFFSKYERVQDEEADVVERLGWEGAKDSAVICDLDGTLCNIDHRLHFVKQDKADWKNFFYNIPGDSLNVWCSEILDKFRENHPIILASGRPDDHYRDTKEWLLNNNIQYSALFMRKRGDFRKDDIVKEIMYEWEIKTRFNILFWIDDRQQVVDKIRSHGVTVLQCAKGDF